MSLCRAAIAGLVAACAVTLASAQTGGLKVRVYDAKDNSSMPGAVVVLSHATGNVAPFTVTTDADGYASFPVLRAGGGYIVDVSFPGYQRVRLPDQRVKISDTVTLPIGMSDAMQEKVDVVATRQTVDLENSTTSTRFSDEFIKDLPVQGRFYQNVLTLAPGVSDEDGDGNPNVNGARSRDFKAIVGGVSNVDPFTGQFLNFVNPDSIEEIEVITAGAGPEFGRAQGGFANIVQKQGTNEFEGKFGVLYSSSKLDGSGAQKTLLTSRLQPEFESYQPNVSVSGPILKDKLWYVANYEYHNIESPVLSRNDVVVSTETQPIGSGTLTWQASPRNKLTFKYQLDPKTTTNLGGSSVDPFAQVASRDSRNLVRTEVGGPTYSMQWSAPFSPNLLVDSTLAYQDTHTNVLPMTNATGNDGILGTADDNLSNYAECIASRALPVLAGSDCRRFGGQGGRTGSFFLTHRDQRQRLTVKTDAEIFGGKFWGMSHQFKVGFIAENERYFQFESRQPVSTFRVGSDRDGDTGQQERVGFLDVTFAVPSLSTVRATGATWGLYARDEIKPVNNLTIIAGVRFDREAINARGVLPFDPSAQLARFERNTALYGGDLDSTIEIQNAFTAYEDMPGLQGQIASYLGVEASLLQLKGISAQAEHWRQKRRAGDQNLVNNNVSPYLSVSWDPWNNAKTKFGFTAGRHYNNLPLNIPALELQSANAVVRFRATPREGTQNCLPELGFCPNFEIVNLTEGLREGFNPAINVITVDRNLKTPYNDEFSLTFERELTAETLFRLTYVNRKFKDGIQDIDINHAPGDRGECLVHLDPTQGCTEEADGSVRCPWILQHPRTAANPTGGDGILDDCVGRFITAPTDASRELKRPDGVLDAYVQNPAFGQILLVGNFNTSEYEGATLELDRRLYKGWQLNGSYTYSRARGAAEDFLQELGDDVSLINDEYGYLSFDQTHVVKINATTITPWGFRVGGTISWQSGFPYSFLRFRNSEDAATPAIFGFGIPEDPRQRTTYPSSQRNDERNEPYWLFNLRLAKEMNLKGGKNLQLTAEVFNLLNQSHTRIFATNDQGGTQVTTTVNDGQPVYFGRKFQLGMTFAF